MMPVIAHGMNVTTILVPLWAVGLPTRRMIAPDTAYVDLNYSQAVALSTACQAGVVGWVALWAFYGQGFGADNLASVASFGGAYMLACAADHRMAALGNPAPISLQQAIE